jgi:L-fuculose-phosphate aldolase
MSMWQDMAKFGKMLVDHGLVESHFGNISIRTGSRMLITRTGCALDGIDENSVVEVDIDKISNLDAIASSESIVHRAIYKNTRALAVIHAHPAFTVIESLLVGDTIAPLDIEGQHFLHDIPVVKGGSCTDELAKNAAEALKDHRGIIVFSHGTFATGMNLEEAYVVTTLIEHSCKLRYYYELAKKQAVV